MAEEPMKEEVGRGLVLAAGVGFLLAQVMHFDIGLGLVIGALAGVAWAILLHKGGEDDAAPGD